jgi:hypothetical protein
MDYFPLLVVLYVAVFFSPLMLFWFFSVGIGLAFGIASVFWLKFIFNDTVAQITVTLSASYFAYYTAQEWAGVSGILTVMILGIF